MLETIIILDKVNNNPKLGFSGHTVALHKIMFKPNANRTKLGEGQILHKNSDEERRTAGHFFCLSGFNSGFNRLQNHLNSCYVV